MNFDSMPSIKQTSKHPLTTTDKYSFIPTTRVLAVLAGHGWYPVQASESRVVKEEHRGYQRHMLRLRNEAFSRELLGVGDVLPEIVVVNSHRGDSSFQLFAALHEKVCANGLIVERGTADHHHIAHRGFTDLKVNNAVSGLVRFLPEVLARRDTMKSIRLGRDEQLRFAGVAAELRFPAGTQAVAPADLLRVRHAGQSEPTLFNTLNVVQENVVRGGVPQRNRNGRTFRSRPVHGVGAEVRINCLLWHLAETMAQLRA